MALIKSCSIDSRNDQSPKCEAVHEESLFQKAGHSDQVDSMFAYCVGGLPMASYLPLLHACRKHDWLACWPSRGWQVSHQRWIWGICCTQMRKHTSGGSTLALKPRADVTRNPKQEYQWSHKKDLCPSKKFFFKKKLISEISCPLHTCLAQSVEC